METRSVGDLTVSIVGLGCNNFGARVGRRRSEAVVHEALDSGINFFDTADVYGAGLSEEYLGRALAGRRHEVSIATKFGWKLDGDYEGGASARWIGRAVEDSLRRLGTDYIDLYQQHIPDTGTPIAETLGALHDLVLAGKVREIGCSNFTTRQIDDSEVVATEESVTRFVSVQNHFSLLHRAPEEGVIPACTRLNMALVPFWPLAGGMLTGKYRRNEPPRKGTRLAVLHRANRFLNDANTQIVEELRRFCSERDHTVLDLAISWLVTQPVVATVIAGATTAEQVRSNAMAGSWKLTAADLADIDRITRSGHDDRLPRIRQ